MKIIKVILFAVILSSCSVTVKKVGNVNMISNRNIDSNLKYKQISTYSGGSKKELKKSKSETIEDAVDKTVKKVPGGEFLMNVKIYLVQHSSEEQYFAVEGDVWGTPQKKSYRGFKIGDKVIWKNKSVLKVFDTEKAFLTGTINALKDDKTCFVTIDKTKIIVELSYDDITKTE